LLKKSFLKLFLGGSRLNEKHIIECCRQFGKNGKWLDLGCDDGKWTTTIIHSKNVQWHGIEVVEDRAKLAQRKGIKVNVSSLSNKLPYKADYFQLVHSNQVIEHLFDLDIFISEIHRVLKPGGILVISTENPASWHNIFALIMGWQMFTSTNISTKKRVIGNPLSIHGGQSFTFENQETNKAWEHNKLLTPRALSDLLISHGFQIEKQIGAGYHPLPPILGEIDVNHSHFYTIVAKKN
jgi:2-polyprenyl-3-methyl-5-hydroxy-6-metoxy-1,4-benzoquinol methylase